MVTKLSMDINLLLSLCGSFIRFPLFIGKAKSGFVPCYCVFSFTSVFSSSLAEDWVMEVSEAHARLVPGIGLRCCERLHLLHCPGYPLLPR